jgi:2-polyprenyl-6-hydroxyphenyl methylase/3-demethylubiquinone-9 3-methyltransferase
MVLLFAPSRNALFARLNLVLPETVKRKLLSAVLSSTAQAHQGFKAYYDHCVPRDIEALACANGLKVEERRLYWMSDYFHAFLPAYVAWRAYQWTMRAVIREQAAETFAYVLRKTT